MHRLARRPLTPAAAAPWLVEVARTGRAVGTVGGVAGIGGLLPPAVRHAMGSAVAEAVDCELCSWVHESRAAAAGTRRDDPREDPLVAYARASAENGRPVDPGALLGHLPGPIVDAARLHTAVLVLTSMGVAGLERAVQRAHDGRRALDDGLVGAARDALVGAVAAPVVAPALLRSVVARAAVALAPPMPDPELGDPEPNLVASMLADAAPAYLSTPAARSVVLGLPFVIPIAVRIGAMAATVQVGRGRVAIRNGVLPNVWAVVDGESDTLLRLSIGEVLRTAGSVEHLPG